MYKQTFSLPPFLPLCIDNDESDDDEGGSDDGYVYGVCVSLGCRRCVIVGNGGILANKSLGSRIDEYDMVVRSDRKRVV